MENKQKVNQFQEKVDEEMKLEIENIKIADSINILNKLKLKGLKSIHRTRLANALAEKLKRVAEEEKKLKEEYSRKDENGEAIIKDGAYDIENLEEFQKVMEEFYKEKIVIEGGDSPVFLKSVKQSMEESEIEWDGSEAYAFAYLYDAFKGGEG